MTKDYIKPIRGRFHAGRLSGTQRGHWYTYRGEAILKSATGVWVYDEVQYTNLKEIKVEIDRRKNHENER